MQSFTPSTPIKGENIEVKVKASSCHASTAPAKSKSESSHVDTKPDLGVKKPSSLLFKEKQDLKPKQVIKVLVKPQIPACIKACDVSSLLDQFLEYEQNQKQIRCVTLVTGSSVTLTPMSSPSHMNKPNFTGIGCDAKSTTSPPNSLTPPVSPPIHSPADNPSISCKSTLITKATATLPSPSKTPSPLQNIPNIIPKIENNKVAAMKSNEATEAKSNKLDGASSNVVTPIKDSKVDLKKDLKNLAETKEVLHKPEVSRLPSKPEVSRLSSEPEVSRLPSGMQVSNDAGSSSSAIKIQADTSLERKRKCSPGDDEDDDTNDYHDFKRKKYTKDDCYWSTSEEENDVDRGRYNARVEKRKESSHNTKRRHSRDYNSDSDRDNSRHRRNHSHRKYQRRHDRSRSRSRSNERGNSSGSDDDINHRHRRNHHREKRRNDRKSPEKDDKTEDNVHLYDIENERKKNFKLDRSTKKTSTEKRKIVYIGNIEKSMSKSDIWTIFRKFGPIEKTTVHYRDDGDNYSFVTFVDPSSALDAIEEGKSDPKLKHLDICFGGRRKFCGGSYVDFDSTTSYLEEQQEKEGCRKTSHSNEAMDFDTLLQMCLNKKR